MAENHMTRPLVSGIFSKCIWKSMISKPAGERYKMAVIKKDEVLFLFLWCSGYIGAKIGVPLSGTFSLLFFRYLIVLVVVGVYVTIKNEWQRPNRDSFVIGFFAHFIWLVMILKSLEYGMNAGSAALIAAMQPILTALVSPGLLGEKNSPMQWFGIFAGFAGVIVFVSGDNLFTGTPLWVYVLPAIATCSLTLITVWERKYSENTAAPIPVMTSLFWQGLITLVLLAPLAFYLEKFHADWSGEFVFSVIWLAVVVSVLAYGMMFYLIRTRDATRVSALQYFVPATTMVVAWLVFGEKLSLIGFVGLLITSFGFCLLSVGDYRKQTGK